MSLITADQLDTSPVEWTIDRIIPRTGHGILWGASTAGKSLLALDMALAIESGTPWLGHQVEHSGAVAYLCGEGLAGIGIRLRARMARQQADDDQLIAAIARDHGDAAARAAIASLPRYGGSERLHIMTEGFPCYFDRSEQPTPGMARALAQLAVIPDLELVIIDTLADFKGQLSLSNDSSAGRITQGMKHLASELDCFVLAIAHPTADGRKMLGAERLFNSSDTVIQVEPDDVAAPGALRSATVSSRKSRDDEPFSPWGYQIEPAVWEQQELDPATDEPTGAMVTVKSATVRRIEQARPSAPSPEPKRPAAPLPVLQPVPRTGKRNGIKRDHGGLHAVPDPAASPGAQPLDALADAADRRREVARLVLSTPCSVCSRPAGMGCDKMMPPAALLIGRTLAGPLHAHDDRVMDAALAQDDPDSFLAAALALAAA